MSRITLKFVKSNTGRWLRRFLEPSKPWNILFVTAGILVLVWTLTIYRAQARDEAANTARTAANAEAIQTSCIQSIPTLNKINVFVMSVGGIAVGLNDIAKVLVTNGQATLDHTPKTSAIYKTRKANLVRTRAAKAESLAAASASKKLHFTVPTKADCMVLAVKEAGVNQAKHQRGR